MMRKASKPLVQIAYSPEEVTLLFNLPPKSVYGFIRNGTLPSFRLGRKILIPKSVVDGFLSAATEAQRTV